MNQYAVYHTTDIPYAYGKNKDTLALRLRAARGDLKACNVYFRDRYDDNGKFQKQSMSLYTSTELFDFWSVDISCFRNRYKYFFEMIDTEGKVAFLDERGQEEVTCFDYLTPFQYAYICEGDLYEEEEWLQEAVVYQIFVDRFENGDTNINPEGILPWGSKVGLRTMFGGDLRGIINHLDYLEDLGVNLLYLTPIFESNSNHKYNTKDYYKIDPQFGDMETAKELVRKCHERGIKIVFDAVFNHSGDDFFAFKDVKEKGEASIYKDWYHIDELPINEEKVNYYTFGTSHKRMPKFKIHNPEVKDYLLKVAKYWVEEVGIDGWRLDVCDEVDHEFWRAFRKVVKSVKKDAIVIGEIMHEAATFLKGDQLDGIMNYPFKWAITDFFARRSIGVEKFDHVLAENRAIYMESITRQLWNLCDSHDTKRFLTEANDDKARMLLMLAFQFTYIGVPYIYYGDEIGLNGGDDPECRKCMEWSEEKQDKVLLNYYKQMIKLRKAHPALQTGDYQTVICIDNCLGFTRIKETETIFVLLNNNDVTKKIDLPKSIEGIELLTGNQVKLTKSITLEPMSAQIIKITM